MEWEGGVVASPDFNSKLFMDIVIVGQINIFINESVCLNMKNLVDLSGAL